MTGTIILLLLLSAFFLLLGFALVRNLNDTYVSAVVVERPFTVVWTWIADPQNYGLLYPHWIKQVLPQGNHLFQVNDQFGKSYGLLLSEDKTWGIVDLQIGEESSRCRLYPLDPHRTLIVHVAKRWKGASFWIWFFHKRTTNRDLKHAKRVMERAEGNLPSS